MLNNSKYPPKGEIWNVNVVFKADKDFWGTDILKDLAYCSWSEKDNCYVFHTMAYGWIHEDNIISFKRIDTNAKV